MTFTTDWLPFVIPALTVLLQIVAIPMAAIGAESVVLKIVKNASSEPRLSGAGSRVGAFCAAALALGLSLWQAVEDLFETVVRPGAPPILLLLAFVVLLVVAWFFLGWGTKLANQVGEPSPPPPECAPSPGDFKRQKTEELPPQPYSQPGAPSERHAKQLSHLLVVRHHVAGGDIPRWLQEAHRDAMAPQEPSARRQDNDPSP